MPEPLIPRRAAFRAEIDAAIIDKASLVTSPVLLVPSARAVAEACDITPSMVYYGASYEESASRATGLTIIHKGLVLGDPSAVVGPSETIDDVETILDQIDNLPPAKRAQLAARFCLNWPN